MSWLPKRNVIVPIDFSDESFRAVEVALDLVTQPTDLSVVHVLPDFTTGEPGMLWNVLDDAARRDQAKKALSDRLSDRKYQGVHITVALGDPGEQIAKFAEQHHAELIVLPSHGRRGLTRLLLGSVAERVLRLAHCPVLVLRN